MRKRLLILIGIIIIITVGMLSLYRTFSLSSDEENDVIPSDSDYLLTYSLKWDTVNINVSSKEEKYVDINLKNSYSSSVRYGLYYIIKDSKQLVDGLIISIDDTTESNNEEILEPLEEKVVTIKIINNSEYNVSILLGNVVGFEHGDVTTLLEDNMILIK